MVIPVTVTATILFTFLLYIVFVDKNLIPDTIEMHDLPDDLKMKKLVNPNIPHAKCCEYAAFRSLLAGPE